MVTASTAEEEDEEAASRGDEAVPKPRRAAPTASTAEEEDEEAATREDEAVPSPKPEPLTVVCKRAVACEVRNAGFRVRLAACRAPLRSRDFGAIGRRLEAEGPALVPREVVRCGDRGIAKTL